MPHLHKKIDWAVEVFIVYENRVLLRMHDKLGYWLSVGGHVEEDEDPVEAARREVQEEVGLSVSLTGGEKGPSKGEVHNKGYRDILPPRYLGRHPIRAEHEHIVLVYFAVAKNNKIKDSKKEHERSQTKWFSKEEIQKMDLLPNVKFYSLKALEEFSK